MPETATPPLTTPWTYRVTILENDRLAEVRLQAGRSIRKLFPRVTPTSEEQSLTSALSRAILEHYFQATAGRLPIPKPSSTERPFPTSWAPSSKRGAEP
jgi:hypothetical protein